MNRPGQGPQQLRPSVVVISRDESLRLDAYVSRVGKRAAVKTLGCGEVTIEAGMDQGRMMATTRDRLFAALAVEEARVP